MKKNILKIIMEVMMENNIKYLASKSIVLSDEDEKKYIKMLGCESLSLKKIAKNKLFEGNIKLVYSQAQK
jgi:DNA-directed RNA polymerase sigma subunit (sigma70/sigma32)